MAADTYEAVRVVRRGDWVLKFLRPHDSFDGETAADRRRQIWLRVAESRRHAELNPLWFDERANCLASRFVDGPWASTRQSNALVLRMIDSGRGYLLDLAPQNLRATPDGLVAIDFAVEEGHPDWLAQRRLWQDHLADSRLSLREGTPTDADGSPESPPSFAEREVRFFHPNPVSPSR